MKELLRDLSEGTPLQRAKASVEITKSKVRCLSCNSVWKFDDVIRPLSAEEREVVHFLPELFSSYFCCPACSKSFLEIEEGRSVSVAEVILDV